MLITYFIFFAITLFALFAFIDFDARRAVFFFALLWPLSFHDAPLDMPPLPPHADAYFVGCR